MDIYSTHLPVLEKLGEVVPLNVVLELGAGQYSSPALCAIAKNVVSYETDPGWFASIIKIAPPNLRLWFSSIPLAQVVATLWINEYDLIFIDDGHSVEERVNTIVAVAVMNPAGLVVMHDYENRTYQIASESWERCLVYTQYSPHTAILWNGAVLSADQENRLVSELKMEVVR